MSVGTHGSLTEWTRNVFGGPAFLEACSSCHSPICSLSLWASSGVVAAALPVAKGRGRGRALRLRTFLDIRTGQTHVDASNVVIDRY